MILHFRNGDKKEIIASGSVRGARLKSVEIDYRDLEHLLGTDIGMDKLIMQLYTIKLSLKPRKE